MFGWLFGSKGKVEVLETYVEKLNNMKFNDFRIDRLSKEEIATFLPDNITFEFSQDRSHFFLNFNNKRILTWYKELQIKEIKGEMKEVQVCPLTFEGIEDIEVQEKLAKLIYDINAYGIEKHNANETLHNERIKEAIKEKENKLREIL